MHDPRCKTRQRAHPSYLCAQRSGGGGCGPFRWSKPRAYSVRLRRSVPTRFSISDMNSGGIPRGMFVRLGASLSGLVQLYLSLGRLERHSFDCRPDRFPSGARDNDRIFTRKLINFFARRPTNTNEPGACLSFKRYACHTNKPAMVACIAVLMRIIPCPQHTFVKTPKSHNVLHRTKVSHYFPPSRLVFFFNTERNTTLFLPSIPRKRKTYDSWSHKTFCGQGSVVPLPHTQLTLPLSIIVGKRQGDD